MNDVAVHPELFNADAAIGLCPEGPDRLATFRHQAKRIGILMRCNPPPDGGEIDEQQAVDFLYSVFERSGLLTWYGADEFDDAMREAIERRPAVLPYEAPKNGHRLELQAPVDDMPLPAGPEDYGSIVGREDDAAATTLPAAFPLTLAEWRDRPLEEPSYLLGNLISTTTRALMIAPTGQGKTMFALALAFAIAYGAAFLHWTGRGRPARVLYIDGEMSARLLKRRLEDAEERFGAAPETFFALSHEDIPGFAPLNTPAGQARIEAVIERLGGVDFIIFDSVMCLTVGDMKEEESWGQTLPWVRKLTSRAIGQLWIHHTGHDATKGYGTKTREWQLDLVMLMEPFKREGVDVSFNLTFQKARERTPDNRHDFLDVKIALVLGQWEGEAPQPAKHAGKCSPAALKALEALQTVLIDGDDIRQVNGCRAAHSDAWKAECGRRGLVDPDKPDSATTMFNRFRRDLVSATRVACDGKWSWVLR